MTFPAIDLLRALAALLVLVYHVITLGPWSRLPPAELPLLLRHGWAGVDLFLVISGFVIALTALRGVRDDGPAFRARFARRRLARIVPLYLLTLLAFVAFVQPQLVQHGAAFWIHLALHLGFVHNLWHETHGSINGPNWSVALEMQFYLLMAWLAPSLARIGPVRLLLAAFAVAAAWRAAIAFGFGAALGPARGFVYLTQLPGVIDQFALGIALALLLHHGRPALRRWLEPGGWRCLGWLVLAAGLLAIAVRWQGDGTYLYDRWMIVAWRPLLALGLTALLAAAIACPPALAAARWLAPVRYLGEISYGIYLWHMLVLLSALRAMPGLHGVGLLVHVLGVTVALAVLSWHWMERPLMRRMRERAA